MAPEKAEIKWYEAKYAKYFKREVGPCSTDSKIRVVP